MAEHHTPPPEPSQPQREKLWYVAEGEMKPAETRALGHLLYQAMFDHLPRRLQYALYRKYAPAEVPQGRFEAFVRTLPAALYITEWAGSYGLNEGMLTRWTNHASIEIAQAALPVLQAGGWDTIPRYVAGIIEPIQ